MTLACFGPFLPPPPPHHHHTTTSTLPRTRRVSGVPFSVHTAIECVLLIGACNPTLCPIFTLSGPIQSHPNTELIDKVIDSFSLVNGLADCSMIIVADGGKKSEKLAPPPSPTTPAPLAPRTAPLGSPLPPSHVKVLTVFAWCWWFAVSRLRRYAPKRGQVPEAMLDNYAQYVGVLQDRVATAVTQHQTGLWSRTTVLALPARVGFGHAVKAGLLGCDTPYVMVVQHDHPFTLRAGKLSVDSVLGFMDAHGANYVNLPLGFRNLNKATHKYHRDLRSLTVDHAGGCFIPMMIWYGLLAFFLGGGGDFPRDFW